MSNIQADDLTNSVSKLVELNQQIKEEDPILKSFLKQKRHLSYTSKN